MRRKPPPRPKEIQTGASTLWLPRCPSCGVAVSEQATVEEFGAPPGWMFYGQPGNRWLKCRGQSGVNEFVHFIVAINDRPYHRLAWIKPTPEPAAVQERLI